MQKRRAPTLRDRTETSLRYFGGFVLRGYRQKKIPFRGRGDEKLSRLVYLRLSQQNLESMDQPGNQGSREVQVILPLDELPQRSQFILMLSKEELRAFSKTSARRSSLAIFLDWVGIAAIFAVLIYFSYPLIFLLGFILIGRQQLALAILMHDGAHSRLYASSRIN